MLALYLRARNRFAELARREEGQGLTEYALIIACSKASATPSPADERQ